ncbi:hypothetical protein D210916BOD24_34030 [Alteromonas sp. D210916BOD_24]|uniref:hypothetical protein n=1 Tax=Alteromonas sp. D210916BOD_24 TaxID=3157618 RepID=UPI00399CC743
MSSQDNPNQRDVSCFNASKVSYTEPDKITQGLLTQSIRGQLNQLLTGVTTAEDRLVKLKQTCVETMSMVLTGVEVAHETLLAQFELLHECAVLSLKEARIPEQLLTRQYMSQNGLIMSPLTCSTTIKDIYRISGFSKGLLNAIEAKLESVNCVKLLYPACGPFAPLLVPLLSYVKEKKLLTEKQLQVTFVDAQPGALMALKQFTLDLSVQEFVTDFVEADATCFEPDFDIDILLLEAMQHGLSKEAHVSIAQHLVRFMDVNGILVPNRIELTGALVVGSEEFKDQWQDIDYAYSKTICQEYMDKRIDLGVIMTIDKNTLLQMEKIALEDQQQVVRANALRIPEGYTDMNKRSLIICTEIETFAGEKVNQYDSGITAPYLDQSICIDFKPTAPQPDDLLVKSGDTIRFFYRLNGLPGFTPVLEG